MARTWLGLVAAICLGLWGAGLSGGAAAAAPSFDCAKAGTATEHAICASSALSELDVALAAAYRAARAGASQAARDRVRADQIAWLARRDRCGGDTGCLEREMRARLAALAAVSGAVGSGGSAAATGGLSGIYCARGGADRLVVEDRGGTARFSLLTVQANGHSCGTSTLTGRAQGAAYVARDGDCTLRLSREGGAVVLAADSPAACKALYCGARAVIDRMTFPAGTRRALAGPAPFGALGEVDLCR